MELSPGQIHCSDSEINDKFRVISNNVNLSLPLTLPPTSISTSTIKYFLNENEFKNTRREVSNSILSTNNEEFSPESKLLAAKIISHCIDGCSHNSFNNNHKGSYCITGRWYSDDCLLDFFLIVEMCM
ncbi:unnamed protein product [Trichobilharzia regenti]|nr:unnamed protein product [Trichobilharzia regenti]